MMCLVDRGLYRLVPGRRGVRPGHRARAIRPIGSRAVRDQGQQSVDRHAIGAVANIDRLQNAHGWRLDFEIRLLGLLAHNRLTGNDPIAFALHPPDELRMRDRVSQVREADLSCHAAGLRGRNGP